MVYTAYVMTALHHTALHGDVMIILHHDRDPSKAGLQIPHNKTTAVTIPSNINWRRVFHK